MLLLCSKGREDSEGPYRRCRPETVLAVVAHAEFLSQLLQLCGDDQEDTRHRSVFNNCEMRSFVMAAPYNARPAEAQPGSFVLVGTATPPPGPGERPDPTAFPGGYACLE